MLKMKQQKLLFAFHPVVDDLKINEDGTVIIYKGKNKDIKTYRRKRDHYPYRLVNFNNRTHRVTKLVCEAWHGMREADEHAQRVENFESDHYTNLKWGLPGGFMKAKNRKAKRNNMSKITKEDIPGIIKRIENNETLVSISKDFNCSSMSIYRVKKSYLKCVTPV